MVEQVLVLLSPTFQHEKMSDIMHDTVWSIRSLNTWHVQETTPSHLTVCIEDSVSHFISHHNIKFYKQFTITWGTVLV